MEKGAGAGIIFVAPVLPVDVSVVAAALENAELLERLVTSWCFTAQEKGWALQRAVPARWRRRPVAPVIPRLLKRVAWGDIQQGLVGLIGGNYVQAVDARFAVVDRAAAKLITDETTAVLAREDACWASFKQAMQLGVPRICMLPTAHYASVQRLIQRELSEFPSAFMPAEMAADFECSRLARKETELQMATHVLCPSSFVRRTVEAAGISCCKLFTLPFGAEMVLDACPPAGRQPIFVYAGSISGRKGVHRLIRVWKRLGAYRTHRLRLVGEMRLPRAFLDEYQGVFEHVPRMTRDRLRAEYLNAQALVFNALADGFGHVVTEAMACGTPVLASRNCGAPDLLRDGVEGRLFEYGEDEALGSVLDWALSHPGELMEMGARARERAAERSWDEFVRGFVDWIGKFTEGNEGNEEIGVDV